MYKYGTFGFTFNVREETDYEDKLDWNSLYRGWYLSDCLPQSYKLPDRDNLNYSRDITLGRQGDHK